jgi:hypothetical protein
MTGEILPVIDRVKGEIKMKKEYQTPKMNVVILDYIFTEEEDITLTSGGRKPGR